jgi:hypothetical protein
MSDIPEQASAPRQAAGRLRRLRLSDTWRYAVTGSITPDVAAARALAGSSTVSVEPDALAYISGGLMLVFAQHLTVNGPDGSHEPFPAPAWMFSVVQDAATRDVAIVADNMGAGGTPRRAVVPEIFYPGAWSSATHYSNRLAFVGGDFVANTLTVIGQDWIETSLGPLLAWKAIISSDSPAMGRIDGIDWWTPELGAPAGFETESRLPDGARMRMRAVLSFSSVTLAHAGPAAGARSGRGD